MKQPFRHYFFGYIRMRVSGEQAIRFLQLCRNRDIYLWNVSVKKNDQEYALNMDLRNISKLRPLIHKTKVHITIEKRVGIPFLCQKIRRRNSFMMGMLLYLGLILFLASRIWSVQIQGNQYYTNDYLLKVLNSIDIYGGMASKDVNCMDVETSLRKRCNKLSWISVYQRGSTLRIQLRESENDEKKRNQKPADLIASSGGTVTDIVTSQGTPKVHVGDKVNKGDILISGIVSEYDDAGEECKRNYVRAQGTVHLQTATNYRDEIGIEYLKKKKEKKKKTIVCIMINKKDFFLHNPLNCLESDQKYDIIRESGILCPFISKRMPIHYEIQSFHKVKYQTKHYSQKQLSDLARKNLSYYLSRKEKLGYVAQRVKVSSVNTKRSYVTSGTVIFLGEQRKHKALTQKQMSWTKKKEDNKENGINGNAD